MAVRKSPPARSSLSIASSRVQFARKGDVPIQTENGIERTRHIVELVYENGSFGLPCETSAERDWLLGEINDFLESAR